MSAHRRFGVLTAIALGFTSYGAGAVPIVSQDPLDGGVAYQSSLDGGQSADRFVLSQAAVLTTVSWWGGAADIASFSVRIFADDGGLPAVDPLMNLSGSLTQTPTALQDDAGNEISRFDLAGTFAVAAGTYYLAVASDQWFWLTSAIGDTFSYFRGADGDEWEELSDDFSFRLATADVVEVPEPVSLSLLAVGLMGLAMRRSRRKTPGGI